MKNLLILLGIVLISAVSCNDSGFQDLSLEEKMYTREDGIDLSIDRSSIDLIFSRLSKPASDYVLVASHRGDWTKAPENTIPAIDSAIHSGAEIVEIDVRRSGDGHLIVIHDSDLDRTTTGTGKIAQRTLAYIKTLTARDQNGNPTQIPIPTLEEVMQFAKGKCIIMIDKANDHFPQVLDVLIKTKTVDHALFVEPYKLTEAQNKLSTYLFENSIYVPRIKESVSNIDSYARPFFSQPSVQSFELRFSSDTSHTLTYLEYLRKKDQGVWVTTISPEMCGGYDDATSLENPDKGWGWCVQNIEPKIVLTDYPELLSAYLEKIDKR